MDWPHAPAHWLFEPGIFMVTAGTYQKELHFSSAERRDLLVQTLLDVSQEFGWNLHAWAVMANHYHILARSPDNPSTLAKMTGKLHMITAKAVNQLDNAPGRKVWFQYRETRITFQRSWMARLRYVQENPVHHGLVSNAENYRWCSAAWFVQNAKASFVKTVLGMKCDQLDIPDDY